MRDLFSQCTYVRMYMSVTLQECQLGLARACVRVSVMLQECQLGLHTRAYIARMDNPRFT